MRQIIEKIFSQQSINDSEHMAAAQYILWLMIISTIALCLCWLFSLCFCCCPRKLSRIVGILAAVLGIATIIATFVITDRLENTFETTEHLAKKTGKLIEILESDSSGGSSSEMIG